MSAVKIECFRDLEGLPSLPGQILDVLEEITRTSAMNYNIVQMIQYDPAIALKILKIANTPLYGFPSKISSLQQAVGLVGMSAVKNIILTTAVLERFRDNGVVDNETDYPKLWLHMSVSGALAGCLGGLIPGLERDVCFTAGLIHDTGKIALLVNFPETFKEIMRRAASEKVSLIQAERETIGFSHSDVAAEMMGAWGLPQQLIQAVGMCSYPDNEDTDNKMTAVISLAKYIAFQWGFPDGLETGEPKRMDRMFSLLQITENDLNKWDRQLREYANMAVLALES